MTAEVVNQLFSAPLKALDEMEKSGSIDIFLENEALSMFYSIGLNHHTKHKCASPTITV